MLTSIINTIACLMVLIPSTINIVRSVKKKQVLPVCYLLAAVGSFALIFVDIFLYGWYFMAGMWIFLTVMNIVAFIKWKQLLGSSEGKIDF